MLFNSPEYIFLFLPVVVIVYFLLNRWRLVLAGKSWLVAASLFFYSYWNSDYLLLIIVSILVNYGFGSGLNKSKDREEKLGGRVVLTGGIFFNLGLLGYFKYYDFFLSNLNQFAGTVIPLPHLVLPLAISFFTFQQIAYLVDSYREGTKEYNFLNYCLFVTFFPQLIAGPIVRHTEMMPQFSRLKNIFIDWHNFTKGLFIFFIGLFKKVVIADSFSLWANAGFDSKLPLSMFDAWGASLSFTMQIYYDFSGYSDMAIGAALLLNIKLPVNFNSPYKALSIQDFWRRWHITLSHWLRDYLYIPLGGNRNVAVTVRNVLITFFLGGLWHGAGWTYVIWGLLHGTLVAINRLWQLLGIRIPRVVAWVITFLCINITFVVFKAETVSGAVEFLNSMVRFNGPEKSLLPEGLPVFLLVFGLAAVILPNSLEVGGFLPSGRFRFRRNIRYGIVTGVVAGVALLFMLMSKGTEFLYFNF